MAEVIDTVIAGAGHAGLALSYYLTRNGTEHIVLERGHVAERWRTERRAPVRCDTEVVACAKQRAAAPTFRSSGPRLFDR